MKVLAWCSLLALSLTLAMAARQLIGEPPQLMTPQHPNVYVYVNNSAGELQNLVLPCPLVSTTNVTFQWFRDSALVPTEMVDPATGTLTVHNITEGEYASKAGVNYYCVATRIIGNGNYPASVRSRTITVFYASFGGFRRMDEVVVSVNVALSSEVALECDVLDSKPPPQIVWRDGDGNEINEITMNIKRRFLDDRRFLYISDLQPADLALTYQCVVTNAFLDRTELAPTTYQLVDNLTRGELVDYKQIGDLTAFVVNTSIEFAYVGGRYGTGSVNGTLNQLFRDGTRVTNNGNIGLIMDISAPGMFRLTADVTFDGMQVEREGTLTIHQLPSITVGPSDDRDIVEGQMNLVYTCEYAGSPMPDIDWFFNGQLILAESGVSINDNTLTIASPQASNSGIYQCIVSNDFGDAQAAWLLEIRPSILPEVMPYNFTELGAFDDRDLGALIVMENGSTVNFFVDVMADPCPDITWFFNDTQLGPSNSTFTYNNACTAVDARSPNWRFTLTVPILTADTSGSYTASLTNIAGTTQLLTSAYLTIPARVSVTRLNLSLPCLKEGEDVTLRCIISGFPRPTIMFTYDGNTITPGEGIYANFIDETFYDEIVIRNVNSSAGGLYGCMAMGEGVVSMSSITDTYEFCTLPRITNFTATSNPVIGERFTISCTVSGIPPPDITWRKDSLPLENTDNGLRIVFSVDGKTSSVEVSEGRPEFNGVYECIAMNPAGSVMELSRIELQETNGLPLPLGAIIGIAAGGVGLILLIALIILLLVCVYAIGKKTSE